MRSILIATDLSARADRAFERAAELAKQHGSRLSILHVVDPDQRPAVIDHLLEVARRTINDDLATLASRHGVGTDAQVVIEAGRGFIGILKQADAVGAELIVLGTHRPEAIADAFGGTTAERVLRRSRVPVLMVSDHCRRPYQRVVIAVDFSVYSRRALEAALRLAPTARHHLLHVFHVPFAAFLDSPDAREQLRQQRLEQVTAMIEAELASLSGPPIATAFPLEKIVREGGVGPAIREEVQRLEAELVVVGTHGRTGVAHALLGSVAEDLLRDPPCDVLAVRAW